MTGKWPAYVAAAAIAGAICCGGGDRRLDDRREGAYRANNRGVALLEQLSYPAAAAAFRDALAVDPSIGIARLNLSLALLYGQDLTAAWREASEAARLLPNALQPPYVLGLIARAENRNDEARALFERVRQGDDQDVGASVNLAQIHLEEGRYGDAIALLRPVVAAEPYHVTAAYVLGLALSRGGEPAEGQRMLERAQALRGTGYEVTLGTTYLEQGRYAEAIASTGAEPDLVDASVPTSRFVPVTIGAAPASQPSPASLFGARFAGQLTEAGARLLASAVEGGVTLLDFDSDSDLDLFVTALNDQRLLRNDVGAFSDAGASGLDEPSSDAVPVGAVSADYDNDGRSDLFVLRDGGGRLYHNDGGGRFSNVTRAAGLPAYPYLPGAAAFVDVDHDGDLDLFVAGLADVAATRQRPATGGSSFPRDFAPAPLQLLRNNRDGTFTDITRAARLDATGHVIAVVPTDFDNRRDIDLLVVNRDAPPRLYANQRDGTFRDVASEAGLGGIVGPGQEIAAVAVGDVNKDDWPDFFFARSDGGVFALSDTRGRFTIAPAGGSQAAMAAQLADFDNDGLLDLVTWASEGPHVFRNVGRQWVDVTEAAVDRSSVPARPNWFSPGGLALADLDGDGDVDAVTRSPGSLLAWLNSGDARHRSLRVNLRGLVSNRPGIGAKVQVRAGSLSARLETSAATPAVAPADAIFGLGRRAGADVARVLWPSGILQAEVAGAGASTSTAPESPSTLPSPFAIDELNRKPSSCPLLFAWNGERFEFVTDFLGGGEMGYWEGPGTFNQPDSVEYVRIHGDQLRPRDNRLELRVTNELEEAVFLDRVELVAIAHPSDVAVYPNEGMAVPPKPFRLHAVRDQRPPARAVDDHGHDVTERIARLDRRYPDDFALAPFRGYAAEHRLMLDLGLARGPRVLLLTGWTDYAFSSDNVAAYQAGLSAAPPTLEIRSAGGDWRRADIAVGIPVGRPQTIALDLRGQLRESEHEVRLRTNMRIYWDQILVATPTPADGFASASSGPRVAALNARGFSAEVRPDGQDPPGYDYARVMPTSPWKTMPGRYTREGDVLELLTRADDQFVIAESGDVIAMEFDAAPFGHLPDGWTRTFLLLAEGFSKEMDINSASPDTVAPLPFRGMSRYPYRPPERYPETPEHRRYQDTYNTRHVSRPFPLFPPLPVIP